MDNLLQSQIKESCKLALPEGLKDLMSDISREVLRAQPENIHQFIADYLKALLEARQALSIACDVCNDVCECVCEPELTRELRKTGLDEENIDTVFEIIQKNLENGEVKEQKVFLELMRKINIDESQVTSIQHAIQQAYKQHRISNRNILEYEKENSNDTSEDHTLNLYQQEKVDTRNESDDIFVAMEYKPCVATVSSITLAGSYIHLPIYTPYSAHVPETLSEKSEKEHASFDHALPRTEAIKKKDRGIVFKETNVEPCVLFDGDDDNVESGEDVIDEVIKNIESENVSSASSVVETYDFENPNI